MEHEKTPELLRFADGEEWEHWLTANHDTEAEAWLVIGKKNSGAGLISIEDALDGALCFGWIDGQRRGHDEKTFLQRYSRRRARSSWSQVNVGKVEALIQAGRMQPAGFAEMTPRRLTAAGKQPTFRKPTPRFPRT